MNRKYYGHPVQAESKTKQPKMKNLDSRLRGNDYYIFYLPHVVF